MEIDFRKIEEKWQKIWAKQRLYQAVPSSPEAKILCLGDVPVSFGKDPHGPCAQLHHR